MRVPQVRQRSSQAATRGLASLGRAYRTGVTTGRWVIVTVWVAAAYSSRCWSPPSSGGGGGFGNLLPPDSQVLKVEERVLEQFRVPVLSGTTVVVHQPGGLSLLTRADSVLWALATTQDVIEAPVPPPPGSLLAAIPVPTGRADTTVTYLYVTEGTGLHNTVRLANAYAAHFNNQPAVDSYVTGFVPAQVAQGEYLRSRLRLFELASVLLILIVVALAFRSLLAPLVVLGMAAVGYLVYFPILDQLAHALNFEVPRQLEPVLLALLLGVVTDYCVLFFSAFRDELDTGTDSVTSARNALRRNGSVSRRGWSDGGRRHHRAACCAVRDLPGLGACAGADRTGRARGLPHPDPRGDDHPELAAVHRASGTRLGARRPTRVRPSGRASASPHPRDPAADRPRPRSGSRGGGRGAARSGQPAPGPSPAGPLLHRRPAARRRRLRGSPTTAGGRYPGHLGPDRGPHRTRRGDQPASCPVPAGGGDLPATRGGAGARADRPPHRAGPRSGPGRERQRRTAGRGLRQRPARGRRRSTTPACCRIECPNWRASPGCRRRRSR